MASRYLEHLKLVTVASLLLSFFPLMSMENRHRFNLNSNEELLFRLSAFDTVIDPLVELVRQPEKRGEPTCVTLARSPLATYFKTNTLSEQDAKKLITDLTAVEVFLATLQLTKKDLAKAISVLFTAAQQEQNRPVMRYFARRIIRPDGSLNLVKEAQQKIRDDHKVRRKSSGMLSSLFTALLPQHK